MFEGPVTTCMFPKLKSTCIDPGIADSRLTRGTVLCPLGQTLLSST